MEYLPPLDAYKSEAPDEAVENIELDFQVENY